MTAELDYKNTLNLPVTDFPMKANLAQREPAILEKWLSMDIYGKTLAAKDPAKSFILLDGPPYANGDIHIGHALNKILKDIVVKSKAFSGYYAPYIPGWDCHGLPIELQVEKKIGKAGAKVDAKTFREHCREYATGQIDIQRNSFKRLGILGDWDHPYSTMDFAVEANIIRSLGKVYENGYLVRGDRPVHWCVLCGSTLADAEVEYIDKTSDAVDVLFTAVDEAAILKCFEFTAKDRGTGTVAAVIWTTTPWTLPANEAVALNPKLEYALVQYKQWRLIIAHELVASVMARLDAAEGDYTVLATCSGRALERQTLQHPFYERQVPIILGEHVTLEAGTGCVHTAPAHGMDDYIVGQHYKLPVNNIVDANGCFAPQTPLFGGMHVFKANPEVIKVLQEKDRLLFDAKIQHSYAHCLRHKEPLIYRATPQWFISMEAKDLRQRTLEEIKKVSWVPQWGETRLSNMIIARPDWCISRQRTWGTPLALVINKDTGALHPRTAELIEQVAQLVEKHGVQAWYDLDLSELLPAAEAAQYQKVTDMLDVWFDSGVMQECVGDLRPELHSPSDLYLEGSDQHRGWFQSSLLASLVLKNEAPYKQVLTHGFVVDADGRKMSKSLGNVVAPAQVVNSLGADVLRLWVASTDYRAELRVSDEILKRTSDAYRRIRNTARFLLANLHGFNPQTDMVPVDQMLILDRWIVDQALKLQQVVVDAYNTYDFHIIYQQVHNFCSDELGSFYLDVIKDRQYTCKEDGTPRRSAQTALYYIAEALVRWIAPILSFTADEIWQYLPGERAESVFLTEWYTDLPTLGKTGMNDQFWHTVLEVRNAVNKVLENARNNNVLGSGLEAEVTLYCQDDLYKVLQQLQDELRFVLITSQAHIKPLAQADSSATETDMPGLLIALQKSEYAKCQRCWHRTADVDQDPRYPHICKRCVANLSEEGEKRAYA
ncbi:MAG TPA: isoleucine--tRNA ligase [Gammaproteobacteria bacterium]|nr:isoleucine--tRNA ligase [Gammaproteobacteria bacterium]